MTRSGANTARKHLKADLVAGLTVAVVGIPQALAYAELAGLPPDRGLITFGVAAVVGSLLGSSPILQTGPAALTSLFILGVLAGRADEATGRYIALAAVLAIEVGLIRIAVSRLAWGRVSYLLSQPVIMGLAAGAGITIMASQLPALTGLVAATGNPIRIFGYTLARVGDIDSAALLVGTGALAAMLALQRIGQRIPAALIALAVGGGIAGLVGDVDTIILQTPRLGFDRTGLEWTDLAALAGPAVILAFVGFSEASAIARRYATLDRYAWDPDRELLGQGGASIAGGVVGGFPVSGSFGRTALARLAGGKTQLTGIVSGAVAVAVVPLAAWVPPIPAPALAGVVVAAGLSLVDIPALVRLYRAARLQFLVALGTFAAVVALAPRVDLAVVAGVALAAAVHLFREERLHVVVTRADALLHLQVQGVVFFASTPRLADEITRAVSRDGGVTAVEIDLSGAGRVDVSGAVALADTLADLTEAGLDVSVVNVPVHARKVVRRILPARYLTAPFPPAR